MYSDTIKSYISDLENEVGIHEETTFVRDAVLCYLATVASSMNCVSHPKPNFLKTNIAIALLSEGLSRHTSIKPELHYVVGMALEQAGVSAIRVRNYVVANPSLPFDDDIWFQLYTSFLHYLCGGFRLQAICILNRMKKICGDDHAGTNLEITLEFAKDLFDGEHPGSLFTRSGALTNPENTEENDRKSSLINRLVQKVIERSQILLRQLGMGDVHAWATSRNLDTYGEEFWGRYLSRLIDRGITTFTKDQVGAGFDSWLTNDLDMLVCLPTGSGKSIIGELRTALSLAAQQDVIWILPTRALVRQTKQWLRRALKDMDVEVNELPSTEDPNPLYDDEPITRRSISVTTPERLSALLTVNPDATKEVGLLVFDEAQLLQDKTRGIAAENALRLVKKHASSARIVLMTAFSQAVGPLNEILVKLGCNSVTVSSLARPTRRINGILTAYQTENEKWICTIAYPPRPQRRVEDSRDFQTINFSRRKTTKPFGATALAREFASRSTPGGLRTVVFLYQKGSTFKCAKVVARKNKSARTLPAESTARLQIELGRLSNLEITGPKGVAAHHAGLTHLEQTIVEDLVKAGNINTVFATPTLAQGVNLPFDISVVSFVQRRNTAKGEMEDVPVSEIQNMLGRAGRAGMVSDGICLISIGEKTDRPRTLLEQHKGKFFGSTDTSNEVGLHQLIKKCKSCDIGGIDWLLELDGLELSESYSLLIMASSINLEDSNAYKNLIESLQEYPSAKALTSADITEFAEAMMTLAKNLKDFETGDPRILVAVSKAGFPPEFVKHVLARSETNPIGESPLIEYGDALILGALKECANRKWVSKLLEKVKLEKLGQIIGLWRSGRPLVEIEAIWGQSSSKSMMNTGAFLNQSLPRIAQLWGLIAVLHELEYIDVGEDTKAIKSLPVLIREGVSSTDCYDWLRTIGGVDRVLSHYLCRAFPPRGETLSDRQAFIKAKLTQIRNNDYREVEDDNIKIALSEIIRENI